MEKKRLAEHKLRRKERKKRERGSERAWHLDSRAGSLASLQTKVMLKRERKKERGRAAMET